MGADQAVTMPKDEKKAPEVLRSFFSRYQVGWLMGLDPHAVFHPLGHFLRG
jgi:hypothetical protein